MGCSAVKNYVNPFSKEFGQAVKDFKKLTTCQKIVTVALSVLVGLATCFLLGIGGFATFKALVDAFKIEKKERVANAATQNVDRLGQTTLETGLPEQKIDPVRLPLAELLKRTSGVPLENNLLRLTNSEKDVTDEQDKINSAIIAKVQRMPSDEQQKLLAEFKDQPEKFALIAMGRALEKDVIANTCEFFEQCEWPSHELKETLLPQIVTMAIQQNGIAWDNWNAGFVETGPSTDFLNVPGFACHRIFIHTRKIFGCGDFTINPKPISPLLAKSIGEAIKSVALAHISELKEKMESGGVKENQRIGIEVVIGQFMETRFPASMIAPLLPYLKDVPGMVSLKLSDVGVRNPEDEVSGKNSNGFCDEHAEALLEIFRSQPHLMQTKINIEGMSEGKVEEFMREWNQIWKDRPFQKPSPGVLLALTGNS